MINDFSKIRRLNEALESARGTPELNEIVGSIQKTAPQARLEFSKKLRQELLTKHKFMTNNSKKEKKVPLINPFKIFRLRGLAIALIALVIVTVGAVASYPMIPAPKVEGYEMSSAIRKIAYNAPLKIVFSQLMDHGSTEKAFRINPAVPGKISWSGGTMYFSPDEQFKVGDRYEVSVDEDARSIFQKQLPYKYLENFEIIGPPKVVLVSPADNSDYVQPDGKITVMFDRPMISLRSLNDGEKSFPQITIEPAISGKMKWMGTSAVSFIPDKLKYSTKYTVRIPKGTISADGGKTDDEFTSTFITEKPEIYQIEPSPYSDDNGPTTSLEVTFNQKMDLAQANGYIRLYRNRKTAANIADVNNYEPIEQPDLNNWEEINVSLQYKPKEKINNNSLQPLPDESNISNQEDAQNEQKMLEKIIQVIPAKQLLFGSQYALVVKEGMIPAEGEFKLGNGMTSIFNTVGEQKVTGTLPQQNTDLTNTSRGRVMNAEFHMSNPVDPESIKDKVVISPAKIDKDTKQEIKPEVIIDEDDRSVLVNYDFTPSTSYIVTLRAGIKDKFGQALTTDYVLKFKTGQLAPALSVEKGTDISVVDGYKPAVFYLKSTNIDKAKINFRKLTNDEFMGIYRYGYVNHEYLSNISGSMITAELPIKKEFNKEILTKLDIAKTLGQVIDSGFYYFDVSNDNVKAENGKIHVERQVFVVSKTALAVKRSQKELFIWATDLSSGEPKAGIPIRVLANSAVEIGSATTDVKGIARVSLPTPKDEGEFYNNDYTVFSEKDGDIGMVHTTWSDGVAPWNFNISFDAFQPEYYVYAYTDRPIYRPADTVYFKGLIRKDNDASFKLPDLKKAHVKINDSEGENVFEKDLNINSNGSITGEYTLGKNSRTGNYTIEISFPALPGPTYLNNFYTYFRIAEYRKPDYELKLSADKENYINGDSAKIKVKGSYYFGAPMPGATLNWTVKSQDYYFFIDPAKDSPFTSQWFSFSEDGYSCFWGCEGKNEVISSGTAKLDTNGEYTIELPLDISKKKLSQIYTVETSITDLNNQSVSNRISMPVHMGEYYAGILNNDYISEQNKPIKFELVSVDFDGKAVPAKSMEVSFYKRKWNTTMKKNVDGDFYYDNSYDDTLIEKKTVSTNDRGQASVEFKATEGGMFKATVVSKDSRGNTISASTTVYVTSDSFTNWGRTNNDQIELVADKNEYKPGDTARILIKSPYQNAWALVTQERNNVLDTKVVKLKSNSETIDIAITDKSIPNLFVSVLIVKGDSVKAGLGEPVSGSNDEREVAAFKMGYVQLQVNTATKKLDIDLKSDKQSYHPGEEVTINVKTTDSSGKAAAGEVSIAVVDKSVLSLTESVTADLLNAFYRKRFLGVATAETLTKAISRINVQVEAGMKGGGGAKAVKRGLFKDTAYFESTLQTDKDGTGSVKFKLPDNLTTWQIMAIGITKDTLVGSQKAEFKVNKDVMIRPVLPRFLIINDSLKVGAIVHNYLPQTVTLDVSVEATGLDIKSDKTVRITLNAGEQKKVEWNAEVSNTEEAKIIFKALKNDDQNIGDILEQKLPVKPYSFPEVVATSGIVTDDTKQIETVTLPVGTDLKIGKLDITIAPTLAGSLSKGLQYLMQFPYGCAEQTASALLPNAVIKQVISMPALKNTLIDEKQLQQNIETGVAALYKYQQGNGGWGIWHNSDTNAYLTAYIINTLNEVQKAGYTVDQNVIRRGVEYLRDYISNNPLSKEQGKGDYMKKMMITHEINIRAYITYVMAEIGQADLAMMNNIYGYEKELNLFSKAYLAMAFSKASDGAKDASKSDTGAKVTALKNSVLNEAKVTPRGIHFEEKNPQYQLFDTNTRTTAIVLQMLTRVDSANPLIPKIVRNLMLEKKDGHYQTTQETAITLIAMVEYLKSSKELDASYNGTVTVNNVEKINKSFNASTIGEKAYAELKLDTLNGEGQDNEIAFVRNGVGKMYYDMTLKYFVPTEKIEPRNEGMIVTHQYCAANDKKCSEELSQIRLGENVKVKMTILVPEDRYYVMVEDFLPAGLEGIDFSLRTSEQGLQDNMADSEKKYWEIGSADYFRYSEVRDDRVMYFADYLPKGVYEIEYFVRATTAGKYHDLPVLAQETYFPEVFGRSEGKYLEVRE